MSICKMSISLLWVQVRCACLKPMQSEGRQSWRRNLQMRGQNVLTVRSGSSPFFWRSWFVRLNSQLQSQSTSWMILRKDGLGCFQHVVQIHWRTDTRHGNHFVIGWSCIGRGFSHSPWRTQWITCNSGSTRAVVSPCRNPFQQHCTF